MRKHNYLIGYKADGNVVYGKDEGSEKYAMPLTLFQAKRMSKNTFTMRGNIKIPTVIYKLVEIK